MVDTDKKLNLNIDKSGIDNGSYKKHDDSSPGKYLWDQKVMSLMWLSYCVSFPKTYAGPKEYLEQLGTTSVRRILANKETQELIGKWKLVWGVSVYRSKLSQVADATMYVAKYAESSDINKYIISIAGTNPYSISTILLEDARFASIRKWNEGNPWNSKMDAEYSDEPAISSGLSRSLRIHMVDLQDSQGNTVVDFLKQIISNETKPVEITVAGHSLGGTISPLMGLALLECQSQWDRNNIATIKVVSVAGMTPGNEAFAEYYQSKLGDRTQRIWCEKDIVPYMSTINGLNTISSLYEPEISNNIFFDVLTKLLVESTEHHKYTPISKTPAFPAKFNPEMLVEGINKNENLKKYVVTQCTTIIYFVWLRQLDMIPFLPNFVEDKFEDLAEKSSELLGDILAEMLAKAGNVDEKLENLFTKLVNSVSTIPILGVFAQFNSNLLSTTSIFGLMDYYLQLSYQHTYLYVKHFNFLEFDKIRLRITDEIDAEFDEKNIRKQIANTILIEYGKAKKNDIKDLFNGEGTLLNKISDTVAQLKRLEEVEENVQPLVFIIEKEKEKGLFD